MMRSRKNKRARAALGIAALVVGLAVVSQGSALADAGGTDRPIQGTGSGTVRLNLLTHAYAAEVSGTSAHVGLYGARSEGSGAFLPDFSFAGTGEVSLVAANGDEIHGPSTLTTSPFTPGAVEHTTMEVTTITGGTGRFEDATGTLTGHYEITPIGVDGATLVNHVEATIEGSISY
jgi:hypothetical protein